MYQAVQVRNVLRVERLQTRDLRRIRPPESFTGDGGKFRTDISIFRKYPVGAVDNSEMRTNEAV